jgi:hypothetical protein
VYGGNRAGFFVVLPVRPKEMTAVEALATVKGGNAKLDVLVPPKLAPTAHVPGGLTVDPRRFTWVYDESGEADDCVKVRDDHTAPTARGDPDANPSNPALTHLGHIIALRPFLRIAVFGIVREPSPTAQWRLFACAQKNGPSLGAQAEAALAV